MKVADKASHWPRMAGSNWRITGLDNKARTEDAKASGRRSRTPSSSHAEAWSTSPAANSAMQRAAAIQSSMGSDAGRQGVALLDPDHATAGLHGGHM